MTGLESEKSTISSLKRSQKALIDITVDENPYIPSSPFWNQILFLALDVEEALFGGAAGGGKSEALLMAALQYVEDSDYSALLIRRTYKDLTLPGALMDRAHEWLEVTDAHWNNVDKVWTFPSGATLTFGHIQHSRDKYQYQGAEFQFIGFDELTQFNYEDYSYLHSRLRRLKDSTIPIRMRAASNPGGIGHEWVKERFILGDKPFISSKYTDNPYMDTASYGHSLDKLDNITRLQLKLGDWDAVPEGKIFMREWFTRNLYHDINEEMECVMRFWDLAATREEDPNKKAGADWTVGALLVKGESERVYLEDITRFRLDPGEAEDKIIETCVDDANRYGRDYYKVRVEQEGGASAKYVINNFSKKLAGYNFDGSYIPRRSKVDRARAFVGFIKHGNFKIKDNSVCFNDFVDEMASFPTKGVHDDQVDALTGGLNELLEVPSPLSFDHFTLVQQ
jgi:predicted phage terminase large subunit-like protein